ncbi:MAG: hypothetical protein V4732_08220 [Pseudomonadota bacterium]
MKIRNEFSAVLMRAQRTTLVRRSNNFAQVIAARYSAIEQRWPLMALIFEQPSQGDTSMTNNYHASHPSFFISPRILLRMLVKQETHHSSAVVNTAASLSNSSVAVQKIFSVNTQSETRIDSSEEFITRIVSRSVRNEIVDEVKRIKSPSNSEAQHAFVARSKINLPLVFKRSETDTQDSTNNSSTNESQSLQKKSSNMTGISQQASPPSVDISRITDQVMQALDKRIVAQRERMGRI